MIFSHGTSGSRGVCVAFRYNLEHKLLSPEISHKESRYITLHFEIQGTPYIYILIDYYGLNGGTDQVKVLKQLPIHLKNINADKSLDAMGGGRSLKYSSLKELQTIISDYNLIGFLALHII